MIQKTISICLLVMTMAIAGFSQSWTINLGKHHQRPSFELPKNSYGFRVSLGMNFAFFDHPFFKFSTIKHSELFRFTSFYGISSGIEYVSNIRVFKKYRLIGGFYLSGIDFTQKNIDASRTLFLEGFAGSLYQFSVGIGLNRQYHLGRRWYFDVSVLGAFAKVYLPTSSYNTIIDTFVVNVVDRWNLLQGEALNILWPAKIPYDYSFKLKGEAWLTYYISKHFGLFLNVGYNLGLPNKLMIYQFDHYSYPLPKKPTTHEKVVVSNSSFAWHLGLKINLWDNNR